MTTEDKTTVEAVETEASVKAEIGVALAAEDWKLVAKLGSKLAGFEAAAAKSALEAKQVALAEITDKVKSAIQEAIAPLVESAEFEMAEGVWFTWDFGEQLSTIRVLRQATAPTPRSGGNGGGGTPKKFDIGTQALLDQHGNEVVTTGPTAQRGMTFNDAYALAEGDGNKRYKVREALLKVHGILA